jgi:hypothetical protein
MLMPANRAGLEEHMIRTLKTAFAAAALLGLAATPTLAAPCKDAKGKFTKCPPAAPAKPVRCKDAKGKFAKCGTSGAVPVKAK